MRIEKSSGITESEEYLGQICERNFLSLWSYPRPFRDQGGGKEICDLIVVMGDDVIVFSDKHCVLEPKNTLEVDWVRWFRSAVKGGAQQAWGAERWLREHPDRVFLDPGCRQPLPVRIPSPQKARYHLVVTVHGVSAACQSMLGGTGSLMIRSDLCGLNQHLEPFVIGDLDPNRSFVHVLDDATIDIIMSTLDTATDFLLYLRRKEQLLRSRTIFIAGEENLLAHYLTHLDDDGEHGFMFDPTADAVALDESWWSDFEASEERQAQLAHDKVSYVWDRLIERFGHHALSGTQYFSTDPALDTSETVLRFMAAEPRLRRRSLAEVLLDAIETTPSDQRRIRVVPSQHDDDPMYVFLLFPWFDEKPENENRAVRQKFLEASLYVARLKYGRALDVVGIATESGKDRSRRSEDALYFDARGWSPEDEAVARTHQRDLGILVSEELYAVHVEEYSASQATDIRQIVGKNPRNKRCPCGSGRKYKHCHAP